MKNNLKIILALIAFIFTHSCVYSVGFDVADFTGDALFQSPSQDTIDSRKRQGQTDDNSEGSSKTIPPVKYLRLLIQNKLDERNENRYQKAPTQEAIQEIPDTMETSDYASKEVEENFDDNEIQDAEQLQDEQEISKKKSFKGFFHRKEKKVVAKETDNIILDCDKVDYDTDNYLIIANGNVVVTFVKQGTTIKSDFMTYDRINNFIKAEGNVKIIKKGQVITGDYIFVDMNEENALIENPLTKMNNNITMRAKKGYVYGDKIVQENGSMVVDGSMPLDFRSANNGPRVDKMLVKKEDSLSTASEQGLVNIVTREIKITQKGDLETLALKRFKVKKGKWTLIKMPAIKMYTNKNHDYMETNLWEIGSYRGMGLFTGPSWVFELPKGSVLKAAPVVNYESGFGFGGVGHFSSGTNRTMLAYGTARKKFIVDGEQKLDDNLKLIYGMNAYMDEGFLGRRRPKYGVGLVYIKDYNSNNFLKRGLRSSFRNRLEAGYYHDLDYDSSYEGLKGHDVATPRFRYMAQLNQSLYSYQNPENLTAFELKLNGQLSTALYGTGDTQVIGRIGPVLHTQYKRWMQDIGYHFTAYDDHTPMRVFDAYRYGRQNVYFREYFRICKYLTLSWFGSFNVTDDAPNHRRIQENGFYVTVGPDDYRLNVGYDFQRRTLYCVVELSADAKGTKIDYEKMEIKQKKKTEEDKTPIAKNKNVAPTKPVVLEHAKVENLRILEDVL